MTGKASILLGRDGCPELAGTGFDQALQQQASIGVCYGLTYLRRASGPRVRPLTVEVASLHRRGRGRGCGTGRLEVTGKGAEGMVEFVKVARAWVVANRARVGECLGLRAGAPEWDWKWGLEDLHVHINNGWERMQASSLYTAAVAAAMVSYFTLRRVRPGTAVSGQLESAQEDAWVRGAMAVGEMEQVEMVVEQGVTRLVVRDEGSLEAGTLEALRQRGVQVLIGTQAPEGPRLAAVLPHILDG